MAESIVIPVSMGSLTKEQIDIELQKGINDIESGRIFSADSVEEELQKISTYTGSKKVSG